MRKFLGLSDNPTCKECGKEIEGDDTAYIKLKYPKRKGFTEIKAYLNSWGTFYCKECFERQKG